MSDGTHNPNLPAKRANPCGVLSDFTGSCLVLSMRHLGDAVIGSGVVNALHSHNPRMAIDVFGRPELEEAVRCFSSVREYIGVNFPVFGHHRRDRAAITGLLRALQMVRRRRYDYCINLIGDVRENTIGILTGARWNIAPVWERGHIYKRKMTDTGARWLTNCGVVIPSRYANFYESMEYFTKQLGLSALEWPKRPDRREAADGRKTVALHTGASHASRHWPEVRWRALIRELRERGHAVKLLGAGFERNQLHAAFGNEVADLGIEIVTGDIACFVSSLSAADVLVGMDSFSVHAAYALGVPVVVLNGSSEPSILTPPGGMVASAGHLCAQYPCYYSYPCRGTESEYICVRGIEARMVLAAVETVIERACRSEASPSTRGVIDSSPE